MKKTENYRYFLDSSAWLSYFLAQGKEIRGIVDGRDVILTSSISLFEIKRKLILLDKPEEIILKYISFIKSKSIIVDINSEVCEKAADISVEEGLSAVDALIYCSAVMNKSILVSGDFHFKNKKDTLILD